MIYAAGVDVGSTQAKAVIIDENRKILGRGLCDTGTVVTESAQECFGLALADAGLKAEDVVYIIGTGYGRYKITFGNAQVTEISCHAKGAKLIYPQTRTVIDIGGQDTKAIKVGEEGNVLDFTMNDKCAAGTGRFLGAASMTMEIPLSELGGIAMKAKNSLKISTTCTVFAESEIISYLGRGKKTDEILLGMHESIAQRTVSLARRVGVEEEVTFSGGVSRNICMVHMLEEMLKLKLNVSEENHYLGAMGAALFALERALGIESKDQSTLPQGNKKAAPEPMVMVG